MLAVLGYKWHLHQGRMAFQNPNYNFDIYHPNIEKQSIEVLANQRGAVSI